MGTFEMNTASSSHKLELLYFTPYLGQSFKDISGFSPADAEDLCTVTTDHSRLAAADAVLFHLPDTKQAPGIPKRPGQLWVGVSMESDANYPLQADPAFMRHFDITMNFRKDADIPMFYCDAEHVALLMTPPKWKFRRAAAVYIASNNNAHNNRHGFVGELMQCMKVDSYGKSHNNCRIRRDMGRGTKIAILSRYFFNFAFENTNSPDYVTEKVFDALVAGTVPVYMGAPNIDEYLPARKCIIKAADFGSANELARYLIALKKDRAEYRSYLAWKNEPLQKSFLDLVARGNTPSLRRLCCKITERLGR